MRPVKEQTFAENDARLRLFYLYRLLEQYTDEEHPKTTNELRKLMEEKYGITMHRTTMYSDIDLLKAAGVEIHSIRSRANEYYLESRKFEIPELKLLIDAVESARFMTEEQSRRLVEKLITLTSDTNADSLKRNLHVTGRVKAPNKQVFYIVDAVNEAINQSRRISFQYIDYNSRKQAVLRNKGRFYTVSPYSLIWNGDYYYLVGYYHEKEDIRTFRVDRIKEQPQILEIEADTEPEDFDITRVNTMFGMFIGEPQRVTLVCDNSVMDHIVDRFGDELEIFPLDGRRFQISVMVTASKPFYGWVFGFDGKVRITAPAKVKREYEKMLQRAVENN